jgi:hypothetical protein
MHVRYAATIFFLATVAFCGTGYCAEFSRFKPEGPFFAPALIVKGEIAEGDYAKVKQFIVENFATFPTFWTISSQGGDLEEAMMIGRDLRKAFASTSTHSCASACVFMLIAGTKRSADGVVRMHRPYFDPQKFATLPAKRAAEEYERLLATSREYLIEMGMPTDLIDRMYTRGSDQVLEVPAPAFIQLVGETDPAHYEILRASCVKLSPNERKDWEKIKSYLVTIELAKRFPSAAAAEMVAEEQRSVNEYSEGYRDYIRRLADQEYECEAGKFQGVRNRIFSEYKQAVSNGEG